MNKNKELLFDGVNNWSNNDINKLGSCRNNNFECNECKDKNKLSLNTYFHILLLV